MGAFDHLSDFCSVTETRRALQIRKRKPLQVENTIPWQQAILFCILLLCFLGLCWVNHQTVDLKVKMDCDGCERRVKHAVSSIRGVTNVTVNRKQSRVTVTGHIEAKEVARKIKSTGKRAEAWPYVPYSLVAYPYAAGAYDKKAPPGFVRNVA
ncbi:hypothetical protein GW17_00007406, partial [Ensete ventricosum]